MGQFLGPGEDEGTSFGMEMLIRDEGHDGRWMMDGFMESNRVESFRESFPRQVV